MSFVVSVIMIFLCCYSAADSGSSSLKKSKEVLDKSKEVVTEKQEIVDYSDIEFLFYFSLFFCPLMLFFILNIKSISFYFLATLFELIVPPNPPIHQDISEPFDDFKDRRDFQKWVKSNDERRDRYFKLLEKLKKKK